MEKSYFWKNSTVYQIYPRSFCDSDGDGVGDIRGIISKLDYLADLGIDVIWLSPVYKSPNDDNGYDISDYKDIQPEFGTMADFDELLEGARARGIKIIMDLVINHTSDEHEWFRRALAGEEKYKNYYIIKKGKPNGKLPNNWGNFFADCPWEPFGNPENNEYYLHLFSKKQPDLNWYNPEVYNEIADIMRFWLDKGVAGFRCDVINVIFKESFADGKRRLALTGKEHYISTEGNHRILNALRRDVMDNYDAFTVGETVMIDIPMGRDLTDEDRGELDMVFAFEHMECDQIGVKWFKTRFKPRKLMKILTKWQNGIKWNSLYFENHDQPRSVTRFVKGGEHRKAGSKMLIGLLLSLRGTPYFYEGQEIGMTNGAFNSLDEIVDIESHNVNKMAKSLGILNPWRWKLIRTTSRDNARTPMQWTSGENAGFTTGKPWLKLNPNYKEINVERDLSDEDGIIAFFKKMNAYRKSSQVLLSGEFSELMSSKYVYAFERRLGDEALIAVFNFADKTKKLPEFCKGERVISNYTEPCGEGLRPYEFVLYKAGGSLND
ncbi:MAG: alpha-glucosidase [Clostridia bacterium]|nr:alpha-glucosidase [Clostridia bacterium]